jgi:hypothetical protein
VAASGVALPTKALRWAITTRGEATVKDIVDAVLYLAPAGHVSGNVLHVDGAAPDRQW